MITTFFASRKQPFEKRQEASYGLTALNFGSQTGNILCHFFRFFLYYFRYIFYIPQNIDNIKKDHYSTDADSDDHRPSDKKENI